MSDERYFDAKFAKIDVDSSGDNTIVSAVSGRKIRLISVNLVASAALTAKWKSGASTDKSGGMQFAANGGYSNASDYGLLETDEGEALVLNLSAASSVDGHITYRVLSS